MNKKLTFAIIVALCGFFSCILTSCAKENELKQTAIEIPSDMDLTKMEAWYNAVTIKVKSNTKWRSESSDLWCYLSPSEGSGDMEVQLIADDNRDEASRAGKITIKSVDGSMQDVVINIRQKYVGDYPENEEDIFERSPESRVAIGFGYDSNDGLPSISSRRGMIFNLDKVRKYVEYITEKEFSEVSASGMPMKEFTKDVAKSFGFEIGNAGLAGIAAKCANYVANSNYEFALYSRIYKVGTSEIKKDVDSWRELVRPSLLQAIDGEKDSYKGDVGIERLINMYGTHVVLKADIGGRIDVYSSFDRLKITESSDGSYYYNPKAIAKERYRATYADKNITKNDDAYKSMDVNDKSPVFCVVDRTRGKWSFANIDEWVSSIINGNATWVNSPEDGLLPIWELCVDGSERQQSVKRFILNMKNPQLEKSPKSEHFTLSSYSGSEIFSAKNSDGKRAVVVCHEYIPSIDVVNRVWVAYPVVGDEMLTKFGMFLGNETNYPAYVCWSKNKFTPDIIYMSSNDKIVDIYGESHKVEMKLHINMYVTGANIGLYSSAGYTPEGKRLERMISGAYTHDRMVKIGNLFWSCYDRIGGLVTNVNGGYMIAQYKNTDIPSNMRLPTVEDVNNLDKFIKTITKIPDEKLYTTEKLYTGLNLSSIGHYYKSGKDWKYEPTGYKFYTNENFVMADLVSGTLHIGRSDKKLDEYAAPIRYVRSVREPIPVMWR